jgi:hypothetical protein
MAVFSKPILGATAATILFAAIRLHYSRKSSDSKRPDTGVNSARVDWKFLQRIMYVIRNILPGAICKETMLMAGLIVALLGRTWMSLWIAWNMGRSNVNVAWYFTDLCVYC